MGASHSLKPNHKLGVPIVGKIDSFSSRSASEKGVVLGCYVLFPDNTIQDNYASLFHLLIVTPLGIEMYCLLTGEKRYHSYTPPSHTTIVSSLFSRDYIQNTHIIVAESNGGFTIIEAYSLRVDKRIGLSHSLPSLNATKNVIYTMISPAPEILYVGYMSGVVKVWHTAVTNPQYTFGKEYELPPVRCLAFSAKHRRLVVGYEGSYENQHGRFVKLDNNLLRVYVPDAGKEGADCSQLEGFFGTCFSIGIVERLDLVVAVSSEDCGVVIWNILTLVPEMTLHIPQIDQHPQILTQVIVIEMPSNNFLVFGMSDGAVLVSEIEKGEDEVKWTPTKKISMQLDGCYAAEYLHYVQKIDTLIVGNTFSTVTLISNFFEDGLGVKLSVVNEQSIDEEI